MSNTSTPAHCPECNAVVDRNDETCPNCGHALKISSLEQEAFQYKNETLAHKRKPALWAKIALVTMTLILLVLSLRLYYVNHYANRVIAITEEAVEVFLYITFLFVIHLMLTILCFYKPLFATVSGLLIFISIFIFGMMEVGIVEEDVYFILFLLLFPAAYIKTIYDLTKKKK